MTNQEYKNLNMVCLYIFTHNITGLKYFGKTTVNFTIESLLKYGGSGRYWNNHKKKYGKDLSVEIYGIYKIDKVKEIALSFSEDNNIVKALNESGNRKGKKVWANLQLENGLDGGYNEQAVKSNSNISTYINALGNKMRLNNLDPLVLSGEYEHILKGNKPSKNNNEKVSQANKGKTCYKDINNNILKLDKNDIRVISGEYKGIQNGFVYEDNDIRYESRRGNIPHNALNVLIIDNLGKEVYVCKGNFLKTCKDNNLPFKALTKSYKNKGKEIYDTEQSYIRVKDENKKYKGWKAVLL